MIYRLTNIENDDFVADLLKELEFEVRNGENERFRLSEVIKANSETKGIEIQELAIEIVNWCSANEQLFENILAGMIAAGLYDVLKETIRRLRNTPEYAQEKKIKIIQDNDGNRSELIITMQKIVEKDKK